MTPVAFLRALLVATLCGAAACSDEVADDAAAQRMSDATTAKTTPVAVPRRRAAQPDLGEDASAETTDAGAPEDDETQTAKPPAKPLTVLVTMGGGNEPVPNAIVSALDDSSVRHEATTGEDGVARFDPPIESGYARIDVVAPGTTRGHAFADADAVAGGAQIRVVVEAGRTLDGVVVDDATGTGVAGARVWVIDVAGENRHRTYAETVTDGAGAFRIEGMPTSGGTVWADEPHHVSSKQPCNWKHDGKLVIRLVPAGLIRGVVRDPYGAPVRGATVVASAAPPPRTEKTDDEQLARAMKTRVGSESDETAFSGDDGSYAIGGRSLAAAWIVTASANGYCASDPSGALTFGADPHEAAADLVLRSAASVDVVVHGPDGAPAKGVDVTLCPGGTQSVSGRTDALGSCTIVPRAAGKLVLQVALAPLPVVVREIDVTPGQRTLAEVSLSAGGTLAGFVVDDAGKPVPHADVVLSMPLPATSRRAGVTEKGTFRMERLPVAEATLTARADSDFYEATSVRVVVPDENVRIVMQRRGSVSFRLVAPPGTSPASLTWWIERTGSIRTEMWIEGKHHISVDAGRTTLHLLVNGFKEVRRAVDVAPGEDVDLGDLALEARVALTGRVTDSAGKPLHGVRILCSEPESDAKDRPAVWAETDESGNFWIGLYGPGHFVLYLRAEGFAPRQVGQRVTGDGAAVDVKLYRKTTLRAEVRGADVALLRVVLTPPAGAASSDIRSIASRGGFRADLEPGRWTVSVVRGETTLATKEVDVAEGGETVVEFDLAR